MKILTFGSGSVSTYVLTQEEALLIQGALDSMGVALAEHEHQWSVGEREIYEQASGLLGNNTES